jgi:hypothetical protein
MGKEEGRGGGGGGKGWFGKEERMAGGYGVVCDLKQDDLHISA